MSVLYVIVFRKTLFGAVKITLRLAILTTIYRLGIVKLHNMTALQYHAELFYRFSNRCLSCKTLGNFVEMRIM